MHPLETLMSLAQIAITLAGFTGLLVALTPAQKVAKQAFFRVAAIIAACLMIIASCLLPPALLALGLSERVAFGVPIFIQGATLGILPLSMVVAKRKGLFRSSAPRVSACLVVPSLIAGWYLLIASAFGLIEAYASVLALACLWSSVFVGAMFILSVLWALELQASEPHGSKDDADRRDAALASKQHALDVPSPELHAGQPSGP